VVAALLGEQRYAGAAILYLPVMFGFAAGVIALGRRIEARPTVAVGR
jgi:hypothetical protein